MGEGATVRALVGLFAAVMVIAACGDDDTSQTTAGNGPTTLVITSTAHTQTSPTSAAVQTAGTTNSGTSASDVAAVVCDDTATRMGANAEVLTAESWQCTSGGEQARIDIYESADELATAQQAVIDFYRQNGDQRGLDQLPSACGEEFTVGLDSNGQRDAVIRKLQAAGIEASTCS